MDSALVSVMRLLSHAGSLYFIVVLIVVLWLLPPTRRCFGFFPAASTVAAAGLSIFLSQMDPGAGYVFPQGNSINCMAFYLLIAVTLSREAKSLKRGAFVVALFLSLLLLIGASRVYLGAQHVFYIVVGSFFGALVALGMDACKQLFDIRKEIDGS